MFSIIIVNYNTRELTRQCLKSIQRYEPHAEVVIVDNGSSDRSMDMVRSEFSDAKIIELGHNAGFAAANNAGLKLCTHQYIVLLNSDTELLDDSLSRCVRALIENSKLGAVHPRLVGNDGVPQASEHSEPSLAKVFRNAIRMKTRLTTTSQATWLAGTALVLRRSAMNEIGGGLDNKFFIYWEDADLSSRLKAAGWQLGIVSDALIKHHGGASGGGPDAARRADLFAWYCYGKHRWYRLHRPFWEAIGVWVMDALDVPRKLLRGLIHTSRRKAEWSHARVTAYVLALTLFGRAPAQL